MTIPQCIEQLRGQSIVAASARINASMGIDSENPVYHHGRAEAYEDAARLLESQALLRWSKVPPTEPGIYWWRRTASEGKPSLGGRLIIVWDHTDSARRAVTRWTQSYGVTGDPIEWERQLARGGEWAGPIPTAEEPTP